MNLDRMLRDASARLRASVDSGRAPELTQRRRSGAFIAALAGVGLVIIVGLVVLVPLTGGEDLPTATETTLPTPSATTSSDPTSTTNTTTTASVAVIPEVGPLFGETTDEVLVFDDGLSGVFTLDGDNRAVSRGLLSGQSPGDQPDRIHRVGEYLVFGWGGISAYSLATGQSTLIAKGTLFLPAVEPDRVWIVDWNRGSNIGTGTPLAWQVDMEGNVLTDPANIEGDVHPSIGVPGGLALETEHGIALWYPDRDTTELVPGMSFAGIMDVRGDLVAYCEIGHCDTVFVRNLATGEVISTELFPETPEPDLEQWFPLSARFSPDGSKLAFTLANNDLVYLDTETGSLTVVVKEVQTVKKPLETRPQPLYVAWSPDGAALYAASYSYATLPLTVVRHDLDTLATEITFLPKGGTLDFVVLDRSDATMLLSDAADL